MRNTTIKSLTLSLLALATLTLTAVAEPQTAPSTTEAPVNAVVETLELRERPQQPLIVQEDVEKDSQAQQSSDRPRGESRTVKETESRRSEKPVLEVHGF